MLYRNLVERAIDAALEKRESVLNRIGVGFAPCVALIVIDDAMRSGSARGQLDEVPVEGQVVNKSSNYGITWQGQG